MRYFSLLLATSLFSIPAWNAWAEQFTFSCQDDPYWVMPDPARKPDRITITYVGDATGTLTVKAPYGELALPATMGRSKQTAPRLNNGRPYTLVSFIAGGSARVVMPDKAAVETCTRTKLKPEELADKDLASMTIVGCMAQAKWSSGPVPIEATIRVAVMETAPGQHEVSGVTYIRTLTEPTSLPAGKIKIESLPDCEVMASGG
ncbi:hypothetical protein [Alsobacter soli]|uniref:hypothetical protein n=1 Tax=Alsobacter soli TaxID=2109933 RepID=UPI0011B1D8CF|nr:hypothetical protein [Alsobacter soli]